MTPPPGSGNDLVDKALGLLRPDLAATILAHLDRSPPDWRPERGRPELFGLPAGMAYLNWAFLGLTTPAIRAAAAWAETRRAEPWRIERRDFFDEVEACRVLFAGLIGAGADDIALVPAASYGIAVARSVLGRGRPGRIIVPDGEHYSNFYAWQRLAEEPGWSLEIVPRPADGDWTRAMVETIGGEAAIVAAPMCNWTDGALFDLAAIGRAARQAGARLVVDPTQSTGVAALSVAECRPDFLVVSAYKWLLGPYGLAFLYVAPEHQGAAPLEEHSYHRAGATGRATRVEYTRDYAAGARRFDAGQRSNFVTLPHAVAGLAQLHCWTPAAMQRASHGIVAAVEERAAELGLAATAGPRSGANITALSRARGWPDDIVARLAERQVHLSLRGAALRVSPSLNSSLADVEALFAALAACAP